MSKRILFAVSEAYPFAKTGGLGDVGYSLPRALSLYDSVEIVLPLYRTIDREHFGIVPEGETVYLMIGESAYAVEYFRCTYQGLSYRFVYSPILCERDFLYGEPGTGYDDNTLRFAIFSYAVVDLLQSQQYEVVHLNDWQCALAALLIDADSALSVRSVFTIHNLAYQGLTSFDEGKTLGIDERYFTMEGIEFYGQLNLMKAGIAYSDAITTVSPSYAREILTAEFGCGLEGFLKSHRKKLSGILNGLDIEEFDPSSDKALQYPYKRHTGKKKNKAAVLKEFSLKGPDEPLMVFIGRLSWQKGIDLLIEALPKLEGEALNVIILGEGSAEYAEALSAIAQGSNNIRVIERYDETLARRLYAAADFLLMPSLFEPCGLNQLIAFRYGAVPIVRETGGLKDSVMKIEQFGADTTSGYGLRFTSATSRALGTACRKAMELYEDQERFKTVVSYNMGVDVSWSNSASLYHLLYEKLG